MVDLLVAIGLYLLGCVLCYILARRCVKNQYKRIHIQSNGRMSLIYTKKDRIIYMFYSLLSFVGIIPLIFDKDLYNSNNDYWNKPAEW